MSDDSLQGTDKAWDDAFEHVDRIVVWRNVFQFAQAPEIVHDGHTCQIISVTVRPDDPEIWPMFELNCLSCGEIFTTFWEEIQQDINNTK